MCRGAGMEKAEVFGPEVGEGGGILRDEYEAGGGGGSSGAVTESANILHDKQV